MGLSATLCSKITVGRSARHGGWCSHVPDLSAPAPFLVFGPGALPRWVGLWTSVPPSDPLAAPKCSERRGFKHKRVWHLCILSKPCVMDRPSLDELYGQRRKMRADLSALSVRVSRTKANAKAREKSASRQWVLVDFLRTVVLMLMVRTGGVVDPAVAFMRRKGRQSHWPDRTDAELRRLAEDEFLAADLDELTALDNAEAEAAAAKLEVEWRVACWVARKNLMGVSPSTTVVLGEFAWRHAGLAEYLRPAAMGSIDQPVARKRVARWRSRWGGRVGKLPVREVVPVDVMVEKVSARSPNRASSSRSAAPRWGPFGSCCGRVDCSRLVGRCVCVCV